MIEAGRSKDLLKDNTNWSAATLVAAYGDWAFKGSVSKIGTFFGVP